MDSDQHPHRSLLLPAPDNKNSTVNKLKRAFAYKLFYQLGKTTRSVSLNDYYLAVASTVRDRMQHLFINSAETVLEKESRIVCYLSAEYLPGPHLLNNLLNLGLLDDIRQAAAETGLDLNAVINSEEEPGLGNGGLGRLAACFMDSMATLQIPAIGYGIRYEFGLFDQAIENGCQVELSDRWLQGGNPWEIKKPDLAQRVGFGGHTQSFTDETGRYRVRWIPARVVMGIPYDTPVPGYRVNTVNTLRLWSAEAPKSFDFEDFNVGDYLGAVEEKIAAENITKVLYPNDLKLKGKQLRLEQQYFFTSCSLQDMIRIHLFSNTGLDSLAQSYAVQLNDTHPAIAIPELMRLLIDDHDMGWDQAWEITTTIFSFTNHTLLPEAFEKWPQPLFTTLLPRHHELILEINRRFLDKVRIKYPGDDAIVRRMSIIDETGPGYIRMAHLACVGSRKINGVAALHTRLLKEEALADFHRLWPRKFISITNGVTPRRWMLICNPRLSDLITEAIGDGWITNLRRLKQLECFVGDAAFREQWHAVKTANKKDAATFSRDHLGISINPYALFDVQVKRIHEYKRQHLNILHIITLYNRLKNNPDIMIHPRVFIFGGKAAPGYQTAKLMIRLITSVADVINNDPDINETLRVFFVPNFNVKTGHAVYSIADLSEQISVAGKEASGTGNMKFAMNGALTIGTPDGANPEIRQEVGKDNFFHFGLNVDQAAELKDNQYRPMEYYENNPELKRAIDLIDSGHFAHGDRQLFKPLTEELLFTDSYLLLADYQAYIDCQQQVTQTFTDMDQWTKMSIRNVARIAKFSSDRAIRKYCRKVWQVEPLPIELKWQRIPEGGILFPTTN